MLTRSSRSFATTQFANHLINMSEESCPAEILYSKIIKIFFRSSLEIIYRYYDQLVAVEAKLPFSQTQIIVPFKWKDAFDKGSLFSKSALSLSSGGYEKACVLFNIAALQSQIASVQTLESDTEVKLCAKLFQV